MPSWPYSAGCGDFLAGSFGTILINVLILAPIGVCAIAAWLIVVAIVLPWVVATSEQ